MSRCLPVRSADPAGSASEALVLEPPSQGPIAAGKHTERVDAGGGVSLDVVTFGDGLGPCVLILGAIHGDEMEGPLLAARLVRHLAGRPVTGTVHVIAVANPPAFAAGTRLGPDGRNLNRAFPGKPDGSPTERIAHILEHRFIAKADLVVDFHTGGTAISYLPMAVVPASGWRKHGSLYRDMLARFGLPAFLYDAADDDPSSIFGACARAGSPIMSTELGGGGGVSHAAIERATTGVIASLSGIGVLEAPDNEAPSKAPQIYWRRTVDQSPKAPFDGLFEPVAAPGDWLKTGDVIGLIHTTDRLNELPFAVHADCTGLLLCVRAQVRTCAGNILAKLGTPFDPDAHESRC